MNSSGINFDRKDYIMEIMRLLLSLRVKNIIL